MTFHGYALSVYHMLALSLNAGLDVGLERTERKTQCLIQVGVRYRGYRVSVCSLSIILVAHLFSTVPDIRVDIQIKVY